MAESIRYCGDPPVFRASPALRKAAYEAFPRRLEVLTRQQADAEQKELVEALPPADKLRLLADWVDAKSESLNTEVQDDLRSWASKIDLATI